MVGYPGVADKLADPRITAVGAARADKAKVEFQALVLTQMVEQMLPKDAESVYGSGLAGSVWKSMLAEKLAHHLAQRDILGLGGTIEQHVQALRTKTSGGGNV
jgi:peptidoglycan hydrolase FlgJ